MYQSMSQNVRYYTLCTHNRENSMRDVKTYQTNSLHVYLDPTHTITSVGSHFIDKSHSTLLEVQKNYQASSTSLETFALRIKIKPDFNHRIL